MTVIALARMPGSLDGSNIGGGTRTGLGGRAWVMGGAMDDLPVEFGGRESRVGDWEFWFREGVLESGTDWRWESRLPAYVWDIEEDFVATVGIPVAESISAAL